MAEFIKCKIKSFLICLAVNHYRRKRPLFQYVEIETINRCNGKCSFCPANKYNETRPYAKMDENLFRKIIKQLSDLNYKGALALFSNNEPFLDTRITEFAKFARENLKDAYIYLYTNGSLLTAEKLRKIEPYLDHILIDNYSDKEELNPTVLEAVEGNENCNAFNSKVKIVKRKETEVLSSRGGLAPNKQGVKGIKAKCILPYIQLVIRPDGKVSLCCNDVRGQWTMGDLAKENILDIWYGKAFEHIREKMKTGGRNAISPCCNSCDTVDVRTLRK